MQAELSIKYSLFQIELLVLLSITMSLLCIMYKKFRLLYTVYQSLLSGKYKYLTTLVNYSTN